jgi:hypothetical protein
VKGLTILLGLAAGSAYAQAPLADNAAPRPTLTLTPAVVMAKLKPGQGWTHTLRMSNMTGASFHFDVEVQDVVVKDGKRVFVPAGETESSIAASAVVTPRSLVIGPQQDGSATVTLTLPPQTAVRAVVVYFRGKMANPDGEGTVALGASLGALVTFDLSEDHNFKATSFSATPQSDTANQVISHELLNSGAEVVIPKGAAAIVDDAGHSVARATFPAQRLLPGESLSFSATCPSQLKPGHYRAISSFEFQNRIVTTAGEFSVP